MPREGNQTQSIVQDRQNCLRLKGRARLDSRAYKGLSWAERKVLQLSCAECCPNVKLIVYLLHAGHCMITYTYLYQDLRQVGL